MIFHDSCYLPAFNMFGRYLSPPNCNLKSVARKQILKMDAHRHKISLVCYEGEAAGLKMSTRSHHHRSLLIRMPLLFVEAKRGDISWMVKAESFLQYAKPPNVKNENFYLKTIISTILINLYNQPPLSFYNRVLLHNDGQIPWATIFPAAL